MESKGLADAPSTTVSGVRVIPPLSALSTTGHFGECASPEEWKAQRKELLTCLAKEVSGVKVFVGNLGPKTTGEQLASVGQQFGFVKEAVLLRERDGSSKCSGFIIFFFPKHAQDAINTLNGNFMDANGRGPLKVSIAHGQQPRTQTTTGAAAPAKTALPAPPIMAAPAPPRLPQPGMYTSTQPAPTYPGQGTSMVGFQVPMTTGHRLPPGYALSTSGAVYLQGVRPGPPEANLYVTKLPMGYSNSDLLALFFSYGTVTSVRMFTGKGYGFVSFSHPRSAHWAMQSLNGVPVQGSNDRLAVSLKSRPAGGNVAPARPKRYDPHAPARRSAAYAPGPAPLGVRRAPGPFG